MQIDVLTLFPAYFEGPLTETILRRAIDAGVVSVECTDIRDFATDKHRITDDTPFGGGAGMVMKAEPVVAAIEAQQPAHVVLLTPVGVPFVQAKAAELAQRDRVVLVCGRYEGVDERIRSFVDEEISVGDFVLSGGEPAALSVIDAVVRLIPGALGDPTSTVEESFATGLLEYPQYTRPRDFRGMSVPDVLLSGDHQAIARWRRMQSLRRTLERRPDLLDNETLAEVKKELSNGDG